MTATGYMIIGPTIMGYGAYTYVLGRSPSADATEFLEFKMRLWRITGILCGLMGLGVLIAGVVLLF